MFGSTFVNMLLRGVHIIDLIEAVGMPDSQVRVHFNVLSTFAVFNLAPKIFHNSDVSVLGTNLHDWQEEVTLFLPLQRWSQTDHNFEVVHIGCSLARLEVVGGDIGAAGVGAASSTVAREI